MYNDLYKFEDEREINIPDQRKYMTETEEVLPVMSDEDLQACRCMKKRKFPCEYGITFDLIKEAEKDFQKC